jgi:hypothetical protein
MKGTNLVDREIHLSGLQFQVLKLACNVGISFGAADALLILPQESAGSIGDAAGLLISRGLLKRPGRDSREPDRFKITAAGTEFVRRQELPT